ncbi:hypothetical protein BRC61_07710 [Halobacteriales archaeon QH_10_65_19]|nr:MAG: hypothetical protein BRC61_07710 [Halobacteriales archaeon QH_10_65_19]
MNVTRRKVLMTTGTILGLAGCIGNSTGGTDDGTDDNGTGNGNDGSDGIEYEVFGLGPSLTQPLWATVGDRLRDVRHRLR